MRARTGTSWPWILTVVRAVHELPAARARGLEADEQHGVARDPAAPP